MAKKRKIFISYKRNADPDERIALEAFNKFSEDYDVFIDQTMPVGSNWSKEIEKHLHESDYIIIFVSHNSVKSDMVITEIKIAYELNKQKGKPIIFPVRLNYFEPLEYRLSAYLDSINYLSWKDNTDTVKVLHQLELGISDIDSKNPPPLFRKVIEGSSKKTNSSYKAIYKEYSKDIWDYLVDMPYMPSRQDREELLRMSDEKRVKIWDYFFRIRLDDVGKPQLSEIASLRESLSDEKGEQPRKESVNLAIKRIRSLETEIKELKKQIPVPPSDNEVRQWLNEDFLLLWRNAIDDSGLKLRLVEIRGFDDSDKSTAMLMNPLILIGPAELQNAQKIPPIFSIDVNVDLHRHLSSRRSYSLPHDQALDVLYGMYYLEYFLFADDLLVIYDQFFDFITGCVHSEQITEIYYVDIVSIARIKEARTIKLGFGDPETIHIEDAPGFKLSLASGEKYTITFVDEKYFMEIGEKIDISKENVPKVYWIKDSEKTANNVLKVIRHYLRLHKGI